MLTPGRETSSGGWSDAAGERALTHGIAPGGKWLYPAFPYPFFTKVTRDDVRAIKAWLRTLEPVRQEVDPPELPWPLSWRAMLAGWNALFFEPGVFTPDPVKSGEWNRGAYLMEGLGHCAACHLTNGQGQEGVFPPLADSSVLQQEEPHSSIQIVLGGAEKPSTEAKPTPLEMPAFGWKLDDDEAAALLTFLRNAFGNSAPPVDPSSVAEVRSIIEEREGAAALAFE